MSDHAVDVLIIGGGIAGVSVAAKLAPHATVAVIETETQLGFHASGRSAALYEPNYGSPGTIALNKASGDELQSLDVLSPRGVMLVGTEGQDAAFEQDLQTFEMAELSLEDGLRHWPILNPKVVRRVGFDDRALDIDTDKLLQSYAKHARRAGASILTNRAVTAIERSSVGWAVTAGKTRIIAQTLINAAGAWADQIATLADVTPLGLQPRRRSMARIPGPEGYDLSKAPMIFGPGEKWYAKPDAGALLVSPADETPVDPHDAFTDDITIATGIAAFEAHMTYSTERLLASWAGLRTFAPDGNLVLGRDPALPGFVWCAGQGGYGMQSAPAAARHVASIVLGTSPELTAAETAALAPSRFS